MTSEYVQRAFDACNSQEFPEAGRLFTLAAYEALSEADYPEPETVTSGTAAGKGLYHFQNAAFSFRLAGAGDRSTNRIEQAALIAADFRETFGYAALRGLTFEYRGDLEVIRGDRDRAMEAYDRAEEVYGTVTEIAWMAEPIFESLLEFFRTVAAGTEDPLTVEDQLAMLQSFDRRIEEKRQRLPHVVDRVLESSSFDPGSSRESRGYQ